MSMIDHPFTERRRRHDRRSDAASRKLNAVDWIAMLLVIAGGLNWGLIGLMQIDLIGTLFGEMSIAARLVYLAIGVSGLYAIYTCMRLSGSSDYATN